MKAIVGVDVIICKLKEKVMYLHSSPPHPKIHFLFTFSRFPFAIFRFPNRASNPKGT